MTDTARVAPRDHRVFGTLDGLRGAAALLVVSRHVRPLFGDGAGSTHLAVDLFFLLSGFVIANAYERKLLLGMGARTFARVRAVRLYPIYALGVALGAFAAWLTRGSAGMDAAVHFLLTAVLIPNPDRPGGELFPFDEPAWSLFLEVAVNAVYVAALRILVGSRLLVALATCAAALVLFAWLSPSHTLDVGWKIKTLPGGVLRVLLSFYAGVLVYRVQSRRGRIASPSVVGNLVPVALVLATVVALTWTPPAGFVPLTDLVSVTCVFPALLWASTRHQPVGAVATAFRLGGLSSYAVYAVHAPLGAVVTHVLDRVPGLRVEGWAPWSGYAFLAVLVPVALVLDRRYDVPARRFLTGRAGRSAGRE